MHPRTAQVPQQFRVRATGVLQGIGQHGKPRRVQSALGEAADVISSPGEPHQEPVLPDEYGRFDGKCGAERITEYVTDECDELGVLVRRGVPESGKGPE
jgi:hypothetical protein